MDVSSSRLSFEVVNQEREERSGCWYQTSFGWLIVNDPLKKARRKESWIKYNWEEDQTKKRTRQVCTKPNNGARAWYGTVHPHPCYLMLSAWVVKKQRGGSITAIRAKGKQKSTKRESFCVWHRFESYSHEMSERASSPPIQPLLSPSGTSPPPLYLSFYLAIYRDVYVERHVYQKRHSKAIYNCVYIDI